MVTGVPHSVMVIGDTGTGMVSEFLTRGHTATHTYSCGVTDFLQVSIYYYFYFRINFEPIFYLYLKFISTEYNHHVTL